MKAPPLRSKDLLEYRLLSKHVAGCKQYFREINGQGFIGWIEGRKNWRLEYWQKVVMWTMIVAVKMEIKEQI